VRAYRGGCGDDHRRDRDPDSAVATFCVALYRFAIEGKVVGGTIRQYLIRLATCGHRLLISTEPDERLSRLNGSSVRRHRRELLAIARAHGARNVRVFGSTARGEARFDSDIDLLVDLDPGRTLLDLVALRRELSEVLAKPVDVATREMLRDAALIEAERDAIPI
jgi:predicted nucleotidyltransferase